MGFGHNFYRLSFNFVILFFELSFDIMKRNFVRIREELVEPHEILVSQENSMVHIYIHLRRSRIVGPLRGIANPLSP